MRRGLSAGMCSTNLGGNPPQTHTHYPTFGPTYVLTWSLSTSGSSTFRPKLLIRFLHIGARMRGCWVRQAWQVGPRSSTLAHPPPLSHQCVSMGAHPKTMEKTGMPAPFSPAPTMPPRMRSLSVRSAYLGVVKRMWGGGVSTRRVNSATVRSGERARTHYAPVQLKIRDLLHFAGARHAGRPLRLSVRLHLVLRVAGGGGSFQPISSRQLLNGRLRVCLSCSTWDRRISSIDLIRH